jgi:hypothetical protein
MSSRNPNIAAEPGSIPPINGKTIVSKRIKNMDL